MADAPAAPRATRDPYRYSPLTSQDSIRLIKVVPELINDRNIGCIISEHPRSQANVGIVEYRALSYLWGDPTPGREIGLLDGTVPGSKWHFHYIHSNLWLFLAHMWRKEQFDCLLWTDRLCLNQKDEEEMAQQIPRMGLIYSQAERVVIWLGLSAWQEQYFQEQREQITNGAQQNYVVHYWDQPPQLSLAMLSVLDHDYWKRIWIIQEVAMAQKVVVEMQDIPSCNLHEMYQITRGFFSAGTPYFLDVFHMRESRGTTPSDPKSSPELLIIHWQRRCTRPQDVIYGLLGMVKENDPLRQIAVDYDRPASDVLFDALFTASNARLSWEQNYRVIWVLLKLGLLEDVNSLEEYSHRDHIWKLTENKVVKTFASISLTVFDALNLIMATSGGLRLFGEFDSTLQNIVEQTVTVDYPSVDEYQWKAITGIILALMNVSRGTHEQWKKARWPKLRAQSFWLCAGHALPPSLPRPLEPMQLHAAVNMPLTVSEFRQDDIFKACAKYRQHEPLCEGSKMILDVPGSRTRLELDYAAARDWTVGLNIWFQNGASENA